MIHRSKKIRNFAKGQLCTLRIIGYCNYNTETVVGCHVGDDGGMGIKCSDNMIVFACSSCHDVIDGRVKHEYTRHELDSEILRALRETQGLLLDHNLISLA